jgi:hypothetical protein
MSWIDVVGADALFFRMHAHIINHVPVQANGHCS